MCSGDDMCEVTGRVALDLLNDNIKHILKNHDIRVCRIHMAHFCGSIGRLV
jgi:hypothetical protein